MFVLSVVTTVLIVLVALGLILSAIVLVIVSLVKLLCWAEATLAKPAHKPNVMSDMGAG